jgi:hypothetical protein
VEGHRLIVCEGDGDRSFVERLCACRSLGFAFTVAIPRFGEPSGNTAFASMLAAQRAAAERPSTIILVADNDGDPAGSFRSVVNQIKAAGDYGIPTAPRQVARSAGFPDISVLMVPWDDVPGAIETLCYEAAAKRRPELAACVERFVECILPHSSGWSVTKLAKLRLRCFLAAACPQDPNTSLTYAWSRTPNDLIPLEHSCFDQIVSYLQTFLFAAEPPAG